MSVELNAPLRYVSGLAGAAALVSWGIAIRESLPRLLAGPICSSQQDAWAFAGHCPACFAAVGFTALFLATLVAAHRRAAGTASA